jgi:hypothetical protein
VISRIILVKARTMINRMMEKTRAAPQMIERSQATEESVDREALGQFRGERAKARNSTH